MSRHLLIRAHVLDGLRALPDESVHCVVTSPPYFSLRDYQTPAVAWGDGWRGHLGLEPTPDQFIAHLVEVFREVRRVLRSDGTAFVVLGDSYARNPGRGVKFQAGSGTYLSNRQATEGNRGPEVPEGLREGDLMGIPWRFAFAAQADGWIQRSGIVWSKKSCMPESIAGTRWERHRVRVGPSRRAIDEKKGKAWEERPAGARGEKDGDSSTFDSRAEWADCPGCPKCEPNDGLVLRRGSWRPTSAHEYIFMLAKSEDYFADGEELREAFADERMGNPGAYSRTAAAAKGANQDRQDLGFLNNGGGWDRGAITGGRNLRSVWHLGPEPFPDAHFAVFPSEIPRRAILAGTSSGGCCAECGAPWARVVTSDADDRSPKPYSAAEQKHGEHAAGNVAPKVHYEGGGSALPSRRRRHQGWRQTCSCTAGDPVPAVVLDPFAGSGTTGEVALALGRRFIGFDLSAAYLFGIARRRVASADIGAILAQRPRLKSPTGPLFAEEPACP